MQSIEFDDLVEEIHALTNLPILEIKHKIWKEALNGGVITQEDFTAFGGIPHQYNEKMEEFYRTSTSFIFETLVSYYRPGKQDVLRNTIEQLQIYAKKVSKETSQLKILMLGDGVGSDSIHLFEHDFRPTYFDFPGSKTFDFAMNRFKRHQLKIETITSTEKIPRNNYDVVICFEVLEHVPDPIGLIDNIKDYLSNDGIAIITDSFGAVMPCYPTHLEISKKYQNQTPFIFLQHNMKLIWAPFPGFMPSVYQKIPIVRFKDKYDLLSNSFLLKIRVKKGIRKIMFWKK